MNMQVEAGVQIRNKFLIQVKDAETEEVKESFEAFNTVTNYFLDLLTAGGTILPNILYGSGTGTPSITDIKLFTAVGSKAASVVTSSAVFPILHTTKTCRLGAAEHVGVTLTEVGFGTSSLTSQLQTHAMIVDSEGASIAITKSATDIIDIYATVYFELLDFVGEGAEAVHWRKMDGANSNLTRFLTNSWDSDVSLYNAELADGIQSGPFIPDISGYKITNAGMAMTTDLVAKTRKYTTRFTEGSANAPIKTIMFNKIILFETQKAATIWAGKTFTDIVVGTGDGVVVEYNLPKESVQALTVKIDGVALPPEAFTYRPKKVGDFKAPLTGYSSIGENKATRASAAKTHPVQRDTAVIYDATSNTIMVVRVLAASLSTEVLFTMPYTLNPDASTSLTYWPTFEFLDEDVLMISRAGGPQHYKVYDFNATTGVIGQEWTKHANMPQDEGVSGMSIASRIPGSSFALFVSTGNNLYSFSLNKVSKVFGENVNLVAIGSQVTALTVNPVLDLVLVLTGTTGRTVIFERSTGVFGTVGGTSSFHYLTVAAPVWSQDGLVVYNNHNGYHSGQSWGPNRYEQETYDPATMLFTNVSYPAGFPPPGSLGAQIKDAFIDGEDLYFCAHVNTYGGGTYSLTQSWITHQRFNEDAQTTGAYNGNYYTDGFSANAAKAIAFAGDYIVMLADHDGTGTNPAVYFWKHQNIKRSNLVFTNPPAVGAVIKADFHTDYIPKDSDHLLDLEIVYSFMGV
jgi:hypothetical protein